MFLNAQGVARQRPSRSRLSGARVGVAANDYLSTQGVLQLDTVNVLARAHYVPLYSRRGAYDVRGADAHLWGDASGHSAHAFEHWGHEASVMPLELLPAMHSRMVGHSNWKTATRDRLDAERPDLIRQVFDHVTEHGPVTAGQVEHLAPREGKRGTWWDTSHVKDALDLLFITGELASSRGKNFARTYDSTQRAWGLPPASTGEWGLSPADARQQLFDRGLAACGIGTVKDICDHFRLPYAPGGRGSDAVGGLAWAASAVERGLAAWIEVEGWAEPALLATSGPSEEAPWHRAAADPGEATGAALLSPFDPVCWFRPRLERMFGMEYRIEIYTPAPNRVYGYYCLPFLLGDQIVGRVDLRADRKAKVLRVEAAWREPRAVAGARRKSDASIVSALHKELERMARWLDLDRVEFTGKGNVPLASRLDLGARPPA